RKNKPRTGTDGTTLSAPIFLSYEDKPVPTGLAEEESERGFASKKEKKESGLPSSQTATTLAADRLPLSEVVTFWPRAISSNPENRCEPQPGQTFAVVTIRKRQSAGGHEED